MCVWVWDWGFTMRKARGFFFWSFSKDNTLAWLALCNVLTQIAQRVSFNTFSFPRFVRFMLSEVEGGGCCKFHVQYHHAQDMLGMCGFCVNWNRSSCREQQKQSDDKSYEARTNGSFPVFARSRTYIYIYIVLIANEVIKFHGMHTPTVQSVVANGFFSRTVRGSKTMCKYVWRWSFCFTREMMC